jgi:PleD family two-component response regulator
MLSSSYALLLTGLVKGSYFSKYNNKTKKAAEKLISTACVDQDTGLNNRSPNMIFLSH